MEQLTDNKNLNTPILIIATAILYFLAGNLSFALSNEHNIVTIIIFASEGIALGLALYFGKKVIFGIFLGQFILAMTNGLAFLPSFEISIINSLEALIGIYIFHKAKLNKELLSLRDIIGLVLIILFVVQIFSSVLGTLTLYLNNVISAENYLQTLFSWWFGNVMGQLLFVPLTLLLLVNYKKIDFLNFFIYGTIFTLFIYILEIYLALENTSLLYMLSMPISVYMVSHKGILYGILFSIILTIISLYSVSLNIGAFSVNSIIDNIININVFILAHISIVFIIGGLFEERKQRELNLHKIIEKEVQKNKEQQLLMFQQNRLAQMGEMIAMISHQWKQPLNSLSVINQTLIIKYMRGKMNDDEIKRFQEKSNIQIEYMSATIDDFSSFFKPMKNKINFCINDVVEKMLKITESVYIINDISVDFTVEKKYYVDGFQNEFGQAILNIINNAKDALIKNNIENKSITINIEEDTKNIILTISDNAGGIPLNIIDKIFNPYFSTKENKNGTGLGLYMSKQIIEDKLNAKISVKNNDNGAIFKICL